MGDLVKVKERAKVAKKAEKSLYQNRNKIAADKKWNRGKVCPEAVCVEGRVRGEIRAMKVVPCGREDCPVCGQKDSMLHKQRFCRGVKKILTYKGGGYLVFTVPVEFRGYFKKRDVRNSYLSRIKIIMQAMGYNRAFVRYHWGGDKHRGVFNPHVNILFDLEGREGKCSMMMLQMIKRLIMEWFDEIWGWNRDRIPVVEYHYKNYEDEGYIGWILHKLDYICRPTLLHCKQGMGVKDFRDLVKSLYNYRNIRWWGKWDKEEIASIDLSAVLYGYDERADRMANIAMGIDSEGNEIEWRYLGRWRYIGISVLQGYDYLGSGYFVVKGPD